jgi:diamine N-acetyltransferase
MSKRGIPLLEKDTVRLRLLEEADLEMTLAWRNQNRRWFSNANLISIDQHREWFRQYLDRDDDYLFVIERLNGRAEPVGQIALYKIDREKRHAEFGRLLIGEPAAIRKGIAQKATEILLDYAFTDLGIQTIQLEVLRNNIPAMSLYGRCGFMRTALNGDVIVMTKRWATD